MILFQPLRALTWVLITQGLIVSAQELPACRDIAQYKSGGCCMVDRPDLSCPKPLDFEKSVRLHVCKTPASPLVYSTNEQNASLPDGKGAGGGKTYHNATCACRTEGDAVVITNVTALPSRASVEIITVYVTENMVTTAAPSGSSDAVVITTITALPSGASVETITAQFTENMVTTTTSSGSGDATIVPIIVPIGKPPVICWGCVPFPANIQLKLPEFCVQILGFDIGNCPNDDNENDEMNEDEEEHEKKTATTTTRSCSTTATATYASVFCTVTEVHRAYQDPSSSVNIDMEGAGYVSTGKWALFEEDLKTVAVAGLWGLMNTLGDLTGGLPKYIDKGLGMFRGRAGPEGTMFDDDAEPQVFIVTRKERPNDMNLYGAPGDVPLLALIRAALDVWWLRGPIRGPQREVTYEPMLWQGHNSDDPRFPGDPELFMFRGKAMVQYQPAIASCGRGSTKIAREAGYRVWVEAEKVADGERHWEPSDNKQIRTLSKRQERCAVDGNPGGDNPGDPDGDKGGDDGTITPPPKKACSSDADCSGPECAGGGRSSFCDAGECGCRTSKTSPPPPPPSREQCSSSSDCYGPNCAGGMSQSSCEEGFCICKSPQDPSICTTADKCSYLDCNSGQDKTCADGRCQCAEKTCSSVDDCGFLGCSDGQEKVCDNGRCRCKDKPPAPAFSSGLCNTHIGTYGSAKGFAANIIVYDGSGAELYRNPNPNTGHSWGEAITLETGKLPYPLKYLAYSVRITAGDMVWSTMDEDDARKMVPRCEVGNWDTHGTWDPFEILADLIDAILGQGEKVPTRDMDCRWQC
ncbi:hypothetical protein LZ30DRAFT_776895 [Colletotrichum cereale]|nr:hypothetical protein LZ30DRAFT_776895 [Colletotrichum cereale]